MEITLIITIFYCFCFFLSSKFQVFKLAGKHFFFAKKFAIIRQIDEFAENYATPSHSHLWCFQPSRSKGSDQHPIFVVPELQKKEIFIGRNVTAKKEILFFFLGSHFFFFWSCLKFYFCFNFELRNFLDWSPWPWFGVGISFLPTGSAKTRPGPSITFYSKIRRFKLEAPQSRFVRAFQGDS